MDAHRTAKQLTLASLQLRVDGVFEHYRRWCHRSLGCVPVGLGFVDLGWQRLVEPPVVDGSLKFALPTRLAETDQTFFALIRRRT